MLIKKIIYKLILELVSLSMNSRFVSTFILGVYSAILVNVMVFKQVPLIRIGVLMLNFGGTDNSRPPNFIPFKTIFSYLLGENGLLIAGINLIGNIILLVPIGFIIPFVYRNITWKKSLALAIASGFIIEVLQVLLRVGIFDIDDVILNALGVMIGYWTFSIFIKWITEKKYLYIVLATLLLIGVAGTTVYYVYPKDMPTNPRMNADGKQDERFSTETDDLCGGTGGVGQIISVGTNTFTIKIKDGRNQTIKLTEDVTIKNSARAISLSDLKTGDRVTVVGDGNIDGSFTANTVLVCYT